MGERFAEPEMLARITERQTVGFLIMWKMKYTPRLCS
jgi:hypothetical protein